MDLDLSDVYNEKLIYLLKNPDNLQRWFDVIHMIENDSVNELSKNSPIDEKKILRAVYSSLLKRFPFLENYWIKFADVEFRLGNASTAELIYLNALKEVPQSLKIWVSYLKYAIQLSNYSYNDLILVFRNAEKKIGYHYHSAEFWDLYLDFIQNYNMENPKYEVYLILRKLIELPIYQYARYYKSFIKFLENEINLSNVGEFFTEIDLKKWNNGNRDIKSETDLKDLKVKIKKIFTDIYIANQYEVFKLYPYESKLKRQFFHTTYLSVQDLDVWDSYLNYLEIKLLAFSNGNNLFMTLGNIATGASGKKLADNLPVIYKNIVSRILSVYHRCLISTCIYDRFWIRLFWFYFNLGSFSDARNVLIKSCQFLPVVNLNTKKLLLMMESFNGRFLNVRDMSTLLLQKFPENVDVWKSFLNSENLLFGNNDENYVIFLISDHLLKLSNNYNEREDANSQKLRNNILPFEYLFRFVLSYEKNKSIKNKLAFFQNHSNSIFAKKSIIYWSSYLKLLSFNIDKFKVRLSAFEGSEIQIFTRDETDVENAKQLTYYELYKLFQLASKTLDISYDRSKFFNLFQELIVPFSEKSTVDDIFFSHLDSIDLVDGIYW